MDDSDFLAQRFEEHRPHLRAVAYRMLGSASEADDAVQEAWLRLSRTDAGAVRSLGAWLTTVVSRVALDMLRSRQARREDPAATAPDLADLPQPVSAGAGPEDEAVLATAVGPALLLVLETLAPAERLAFVLHDTFGVPFEEIGAILDRSPDATKQLAHRARRKIRGTEPLGDDDPARHRQVLDAFLAASRTGDFEALVAVLHPAVVLRADAAAVQMGSPEALAGQRTVAAVFSGRAQAATPALVDGRLGLQWVVGGRPKVVWAFDFDDGAVVAIDMIADAERLATLAITDLTH